MDALVLTAYEAAKALRVDPGEFNKRLEAGEVPAYRDGRNWKIPKSLLQAYIENKAIAEAKERRRLHEDEVEQAKV